MDHDQTMDMLRAVAAAFDRHDLDGILVHFADDAVFESPRGLGALGTAVRGDRPGQVGLRGPVRRDPGCPLPAGRPLRRWRARRFGVATVRDDRRRGPDRGPRVRPMDVPRWQDREEGFVLEDPRAVVAWPGPGSERQAGGSTSPCSSPEPCSSTSVSRRPPAPGLAVGHDGMAGQRPAVGGPAGQLALVHVRPDAGHDPGAPLGAALAVVPQVHRGARQIDAPERDIEQGEALMSAGHDPTVAACGGGRPCPWCPAYHRWPAACTETDVDARANERGSRPRLHAGDRRQRRRHDGSAARSGLDPRLPAVGRADPRPRQRAGHRRPLPGRPAGGRSRTDRRERGPLGRHAELHLRTSRRQSATPGGPRAGRAIRTAPPGSSPRCTGCATGGSSAR